MSRDNENVPSMHAVNLNPEIIFEKFGLDPKYGFVGLNGCWDVRLTGEYEILEKIASDLPALTTTGKLSSVVENLPVLSMAPFANDRKVCERALLILSFISHCYVRGRLDELPKKKLPNSLAKPWIEVADILGTVPICTYVTTVILNFRPLNIKEPLNLENIWTIFTGSGSIDESWFFMVSTAMELCSGNFIRLYIEIVNFLRSSSYDEALNSLSQLSDEILGLERLLLRMYEENIPSVFYQRVRRYLSGWESDPGLPGGLYYGDDPVPRRYHGGSNAQSPLLQSLDIALGVNHAKKVDHEDTGVSSAGDYLIELRKYMLGNHREFIKWMEQNINIRSLVMQAGVPIKVVDAFNDCLNRLKSIRDKHLAIVSLYIVAQANRTHGPLIGTGGSNPVPFLKEIRSHMTPAYVSPKDEN